MPGKTIIEVDQLSKRFRLGATSSGTFKDDLSRWWAMKILGKKDPLSVVGDDRGLRPDILWALHELSFSVIEGEAMGIIGKNGAGKSTLLKILSRITRPTSGSIRGRGRIASLLEVGTGFHGDLTGKENIFLNGNIMGMTRKEVASRLDEIVEFAGVSSFLETPVKRYSSGMFVRLAFSVAAHLNSDILVVDEVLAVGDAEFQKKCLGKMRDATRTQGRTVLFVSHNTQAVQNFCQRAIWLDKGKLVAQGDAQSVCQQYLNSFQQNETERKFDDPSLAPGNELLRIKKLRISPLLNAKDSPADVRTPFSVQFHLYCNKRIDLVTDLLIFSASGECIFDAQSPIFKSEKGIIKGECTIPGNLLNDGSYYISFWFTDSEGKPVFQYDECLYFTVEDFRENTVWYGKWWGYVRPKLDFSFTIEKD